MLIVAVLAALSVAAAAGAERRACRATGYFEYTFQELIDGSMVAQRTKRIDILQSDMEVVATSAGQSWSTATDAKRFACSAAAACFVRQAAGSDECTPPVGSGVIFETIRKPPGMDDWRRRVACNHALAGNVPGLKKTADNKVILVKTKIVATGSRDGITRHADATVSEPNRICWDPPAGGGGRPPRAPNSPPPAPEGRPSRTDPGHQPSRTDSGHQPSRTNPPSPIESIRLTVTPAAQKGKCPASVLMQARIEVRQPVAVRWWVTGEDGYASPKYERSFTQPENALQWRRHIDPQPTGRDRMIQLQGGTVRAPVHEGYFEMHLETKPSQGRSLPLGASDRASFTVDCNPETPATLKDPG
jgi:hypothetical protein